MNKKLKVSVLVNTYNQEAFITQAIESVLMQNTSFDYEVVIIEDCSTDRTRDIVLGLQRKAPERIRLMLAETNTWDNKNFVLAIREAAGSYIALLEGDDYWTSPLKLQKQVDFLESHREFAMCFHNALVIYEDERSEPHTSNSGGRAMTLEDLWSSCFIKTCTLMFRKETFLDVPQWFDSMELADWAMYILIAQHGKIEYLDEVMAVYRKHSGGSWSGLDAIQQLKRTIDFYEEMNSNLGFRYNETVKDVLCRHSYALSSEYEQKGDWKRANQYLEKCIRVRTSLLEESLSPQDRGNIEVERLIQRETGLYRDRWTRLLSRIMLRIRTPFNRVLMGIKTLYRSVLGKSTGAITADPNPISVSYLFEGGRTTLSWTSTGTETIELRIGKPDGPLWIRTSPSGRVITGKWVFDSMTFYLQDVSGGLPLTSANTVGKVRVSVVTSTEPTSRIVRRFIKNVAKWVLPLPIEQWLRTKFVRSI